MATPFYDGVLGDRLEAARGEVERAGQQAAAFRERLSESQAAALEQQAEQRAAELAAQLTEDHLAMIEVLRRQLRWARDQLAVAAGVIAVLESTLAPPPAPGAARPADDPADVDAGTIDRSTSTRPGQVSRTG